MLLMLAAGFRGCHIAAKSLTPTASGVAGNLANGGVNAATARARAGRYCAHAEAPRRFQITLIPRYSAKGRSFTASNQETPSSALIQIVKGGNKTAALQHKRVQKLS